MQSQSVLFKLCAKPKSWKYIYAFKYAPNISGIRTLRTFQASVCYKSYSFIFPEKYSILLVMSIQPLSHEFFHSYPQAIKTGVLHHAFDAIIKLESLWHDLRIMGRVLNTSTRFIEANRQAKHSHNGEDCKKIDNITRQLVRVRYAIDYECFNFSFPS